MCVSAFSSFSCLSLIYVFFCFFFFNDTATTEIYTLSLHDALPIYRVLPGRVALDAALSRGPPACAHPFPRRHQRKVILPEGRAGVRPGVRAHRHHLERGLAARAGLLRVRRRGLADRKSVV